MIASVIPIALAKWVTIITITFITTKIMFDDIYKNTKKCLIDWKRIRIRRSQKIKEKELTAGGCRDKKNESIIGNYMHKKKKNTNITGSLARKTLL